MIPQPTRRQVEVPSGTAVYSTAPVSIVEQIKSDLQDRINAGRPLPQKMTLESIANLYQVSITPVRAAINDLISEGLLIKGENRRLSPAKATAAPVANADHRPVILPDYSNEMLKIVAKDLVHLSLQGESVHLREEETAEKYQLSRSALRNILHRLAGFGLLEHLPRRGWVVRPFRQKDLKAFLEVRELLELRALDQARPHLKDEDLQRILNGNQIPQSDNDPPLIDNSLHAYLIEKADNYYISDFFHRHGRYYNVLFEWEDGDRDAAIESVRHHQEILQALLLRDWKAAKKALANHIRSNHPVLSRIVDRNNQSRAQYDSTSEFPVS